jgi:molybdopterin molybdotransferase
VFDVDTALGIVLDAAAASVRPDRMAQEAVPLSQSVKRILREDVISDSDYPPFDKAIRDGFAVRHEDVQRVPCVLSVKGESRAGLAAAVTVEREACCEVMTGAALPPGADAVVMVEHTERLAHDTVRILRSVREGEGLLRQGAEARRGEKILAAGKRIQFADIGALASVGLAQPRVSSRPRVAILATGDELVDVRQTPSASQIRNSNSYTLAAQVLEAGGEPVMLGIARDNLEDLRTRIGEALQHDIALVSGGVSMGKYDFVEPVFAEFNVDVLFDSVAMKPGKPTVFGRRGETFVFGLPGNPVSTLVAFHMFVRPLIQTLLHAAEPQAAFLRARLDVPAKRDAARTAIVPALTTFAADGYHIRTAPWKGSSDLAGLARANALIIIPRGEGAVDVGDEAEFIPLE